MDSWQEMWTYVLSGQRIDFVDPQPDQIRPFDIAQALARECRWANQIGTFFSVAQHCCMVSDRMKGPTMRLAALLHDGAEAYLRDVPAPVLTACPQMRWIHERIGAAIAARFGLKRRWMIGAEESVEHHRVVCTEVRDLLNVTEDADEKVKAWIERASVYPYAEKMVPWNSERALDEYSERIIDLLKKTRVSSLG